MQSLSQNKVAVREFETENFKPEHISYADGADIMIIAPATANTVSKIANGYCDNLLTSIVCAFNKPVIIAPAMNRNMWENPVIKENIAKLYKLGYEILEPEKGFLACGYSGQGRLCRTDKIFEKAVEILHSSDMLKGKKVIVTAGGTIEDIDPVRYISNYSSGKMGIALADAAKSMGAYVVLISTVDVDKSYNVIKVKSALDMQSAVKSEITDADFVIMAAAVADYRVKNYSRQKIKKTSSDEITLELVKNPDILQEICSMKNNSVCVAGFCAENENLTENAKAKIVQKGCDFIIANDISRTDIGFSSDYNEVTIIDKDGNVTKLEKTDKNRLAKQILEVIYGRNCSDNRELCTSQSC